MRVPVCRSLNKNWLSIVVITAVLSLVVCEIPHFTQSQIDQKVGSTPVMYGNTIRIRGNSFTYHLHSHLVNYPRGSGYQSVTGMPDAHDYNSLWTIKEPHQQAVKTYNQQVKCGDAIRLEHVLTKKNLHSEEIFQSMITMGQQVSAFGINSQGNQNDNWVLDCENKEQGQAFLAGDVFQLVHENTQKILKMSRYYQYGYQNWENCPFQGQLQVSATARSSAETKFKIVGGVFFKEAAKIQSKAVDQNEEL